MAYVYSVQEFEEIKAKYQTGTSLEILATEYNKSVASIRMKLVKAGIYQKQTTSSSKPSSTSKSALAEEAKRQAILLRDFGPAPF